MLTGPQGLRLRQIASAGVPAQRIAKATRWLKDHFADPLRIEAIAKRVRMSPLAFHLHFKGVTALSPLQYQKRLRLQKARRLMLGQGLDAAEAAFQVRLASFRLQYEQIANSPAAAESPAVDTRCIRLFHCLSCFSSTSRPGRWAFGPF